MMINLIHKSPKLYRLSQSSLSHLSSFSNSHSRLPPRLAHFFSNTAKFIKKSQVWLRRLFWPFLSENRIFRFISWFSLTCKWIACANSPKIGPSTKGECAKLCKIGNIEQWKFFFSSVRRTRREKNFSERSERELEEFQCEKSERVEREKSKEEKKRLCGSQFFFVHYQSVIIQWKSRRDDHPQVLRSDRNNQ